MTWSRHGPPPGRRGYHHGNLREALIRATLDLIAERGLSGFTFAEAARAARAFAVLRAAVEAVCATLPLKSRPPVLMMSLHVWALSHGIASLFGRGDAGRRKLPMSPEELLEAAVLIYLGGLGLGEHAPAS